MFTEGATLPEVFGTEVPKGNNADLRTGDGSWQSPGTIGSERVKPFGYGVKFTIADNQTEVTKYNNPNKSLDDFYKGMKIGEIWGT